MDLSQCFTFSASHCRRSHRFTSAFAARPSSRSTSYALSDDPDLIHASWSAYPFPLYRVLWEHDEERTIMKIPGIVIVLLTVGALSAVAQESPGEQIKYGAKKTGEAIKDTAKAVGRTTKSTAKTVGRKTKEAWRETKAKAKEVTEERQWCGA